MKATLRERRPSRAITSVALLPACGESLSKLGPVGLATEFDLGKSGNGRPAPSDKPGDSLALGVQS
jgi:hypothetical protein